MVAINVFPRSLLIDEKLSIDVVGLQSNAAVTLRASVTECGKTFDSVAHFKADSRGYVCLNKHRSLGGTYTGVQCMGLFTSMLSSPKEKAGTRLLKKDVTTPLVTELIVYYGFHSINECYDSSPDVVASTTVERWYMSKDVERIPVRSGNIRGMLFKPKGYGPFPGVIDMFGGIGRCVQFRSSLLASHGFAALALPYFGFGHKDLPLSLHKVTMDYFEEAVDWLIEQKFVKNGGIGLVGVCLGGEIAIKLSVICGRKIQACISINGCPFSNATHPTSKYKQQENSVVQPDYSKVKFIDGAVQLLPYFPLASLTKETKNAMSKIEKSECEFLFISGGGDQVWPASSYAKLAGQYLSSNGKNNWTVVNYPRAGHLIEPPYSPLCSVVYLDLIDALCVYGGHHDEHALAQEDSWKKIIAFLHKYVGKSIQQTAPSITSQPLNSKL